MQRIKVPEAKILPSGSYRCRVQLPNGERKSFTAETKAAAEQKAADHVARFLAGVEEVKQKAKQLGTCVDKYINSGDNVFSPSTIEGYEKIKRNYLKEIETWDITTVSKDQWQTYVNNKSKNYSPKTVRNIWGLISSVLSQELGHSYKIKLPSKDTPEHPFLDDEQVKVFLKLIEGTDIELACILGLHSLRLSEIRALKWKDIDIKKNTITISETIVKGKNSELHRRKKTKTKKSARVVNIFILKLIEFAENKPKDENVLQITYGHLYYWINKICATNDLPLIGVHGLRHTFASICFCQNPPIPIEIVMKLGGWSDPEVLRDIYMHIPNKVKQSYANILTEFYA